MPNTPDNKPTIFDTAMQTLNEKEINWIRERKEQEAYQKLNGYIMDIITIIELVDPDSKESIKISSDSYSGAQFNGIEFTGNVPQYDKLQANIRLLRIDSADSEKTTAEVMVSMGLYPAEPFHSNEELISGDYTLGNNLLVKNHNNLSSNNVVPSESAFEDCLRDIKVIVNTAEEMLQGPSL